MRVCEGTGFLLQKKACLPVHSLYRDITTVAKHGSGLRKKHLPHPMLVSTLRTTTGHRQSASRYSRSDLEGRVVIGGAVWRVDD